MKKSVICLAVALAIVATPAPAIEFLGFGKKEPIDLNDARAVVEMLRPASKGGEFDVYMSIRGNGGISVIVKLPDDTSVHGHGDDLKSALESLAKGMDRTSGLSKSAAESARAILNQGKASQ